MRGFLYAAFRLFRFPPPLKRQTVVEGDLCQLDVNDNLAVFFFTQSSQP